MHRRDVLRRSGLVAAAGGVGALAGCTGVGEGEAEPALESASVDYREDDGELAVSVTVENTGETEATGTVYVTVTTVETTTEPANGTADEPATVADRESVEVTVPAGATETVDVAFEFTMAQFRRDGSIDVDVRT